MQLPPRDYLYCKIPTMRRRKFIPAAGFAGAGFETEFAGACFSPRGKIMFVYIQDEELRLAITLPQKPAA